MNIYVDCHIYKFNSMNKVYNSLFIAIFSLILLLFSSCSKEVTLDTGEDIVVVECILSCDSVQHLNLSYTHPKTQKMGNSLITEAQATLFDVTANVSAGSFQLSDDGWYLSYSAIPQHSYRLDIDVPGHDHISARQTMPKQVDIYSFLWWIWSNQGAIPIYDNLDYGQHFWGTVFYVTDLPDRTWISAISYNEAKGTYSVVDEICSDYPYIDNFNITGDLFEPIVMQIDTCGKTLSYTICEGLEGQPLHKKYLRTNMSQTERSDWGGYTFIVCGSFFEQNNPKPDEPLGSKGGILFTTASEDYDRYLQESIYYQQQQESTDMSSIYMRDNIFSNIEGGVGLFGAKTQCLEKWIMKDVCYKEAGLK